ncbi:dTMP kinase [Streptomyces sp. DH-12]|uniref:dTMP kinase n=1 Tax=unclassified Streptomyces TaxID=2593676 RepID=UPI000CCF8299|nr:dTMP kinase [Streptomyces sp. DH-12]PNV30891.1 dTMP kinase [Streptomyces sp. DH-12]
MTGARKGIFVSIDGPSGVGKSTTIRNLRTALSTRSVAAQWTVEPPSGDFLGDFTRTHGGQLHGMALACLVAAARYRHVETTINPALARGDLLISDRYVASTFVLQRLDGVPLDFLRLLNAYAPPPDLAVILTAAPHTIAGRVARAGVTHRFRADPTAPAREVELYQDAAASIEGMGAKVLGIDTTEITPPEVAQRIADAILALPLPSEASATSPTPQET